MSYRSLNTLYKIVCQLLRSKNRQSFCGFIQSTSLLTMKKLTNTPRILRIRWIDSSFIDTQVLANRQHYLSKYTAAFIEILHTNGFSASFPLEETFNLFEVVWKDNPICFWLYISFEGKFYKEVIRVKEDLSFALKFCDLENKLIQVLLLAEKKRSSIIYLYL